MKDKILYLVNNWPGDEDNFIPGSRLANSIEYELSDSLRHMGFDLNWTGNGYLLVIIQKLV